MSDTSMSQIPFSKLEQAKNSAGPAAAIDALIETLTQRKDYDQLFDALLLRKRFEMGLPLVRPTSADNIPDDKLEEFENCYIDTARRIGMHYLEDGNIPRAWMYLRHIREAGPVREALEKIDPQRDASEETDELIGVALYEGAHPTKGLQIMLRVNGTCNTITALDQHMPHLEPGDRRQAAKLLVNELYADLCHTVQQEVQQQLAGVPTGDSLRELIKERDWLFENDNYHIDVSHLNAVVRFARFLDPEDPELDKAMQLAEYGSQLAEQFQYPADPPFDNFYPAHLQFFHVLADEGREEGLEYFRRKIEEEPDEEDRPMVAYVLVDLLMRINRLGEALEVARQHLSDIEDPNGFSFSKLCEQAGRLDTLLECARHREDLVNYTAALIEGNSRRSQ